MESPADGLLGTTACDATFTPAHFWCYHQNVAAVTFLSAQGAVAKW